MKGASPRISGQFACPALLAGQGPVRRNVGSCAEQVDVVPVSDNA